MELKSLKPPVQGPDNGKATAKEALLETRFCYIRV